MDVPGTETLGFGLQSLLESLTCPFAPLAFYFQLNLSQCQRTLCSRFHPFPFVVGSRPAMMRNRYPLIMGAVSRCARWKIKLIAVAAAGFYFRRRLNVTQSA